MILSVVVPVYNEAENVRLLYQELTVVLRSFDEGAEILFVEDGSTDATYSLLKRLNQEDPAVTVIRLSRNFGQTAALAAGIAHARGEIIVTLDGDLQNDPQDIPRLIAKLEEGYDVVVGWRVNRQDRFLTRRLPSIIANWLISFTTKVKMHDYGCTIKAFRSELAKSLSLYGELHRFIPVLARDLGAMIVEMPVNHRPRSNGKSKYGLSRTARVMLDLLTVKFLSTYSTRPIHVFGFLGLLSTLIGTVMTGYLGIERIFFNVGLGDRPILLLSILLMVVGIQFITMGLLGEMLVRVYHEGQNKPIFVVRNILDSSHHPSVLPTASQRATLVASSKTVTATPEPVTKKDRKTSRVQQSVIRSKMLD
jgi:glycosyltransferase involved in cell wall biosynthesis